MLTRVASEVNWEIKTLTVRKKKKTEGKTLQPFFWLPLARISWCFLKSFISFVIVGELYGRKNKVFDDKYLTSFWSQGAAPARGTRKEGGREGGEIKSREQGYPRCKGKGTWDWKPDVSGSLPRQQLRHLQQGQKSEPSLKVSPEEDIQTEPRRALSLLCEDTQYAADSFLPELHAGTVSNGNAASRRRSCPDPAPGHWAHTGQGAAGGARGALGWLQFLICSGINLPHWQPENGTKWHWQMKETTGKQG